MEKEVAQKMMAEIMGVNDEINKVCQTIELIADEEEKLTTRRAMGGVFSAVYSGLMLPIIRQYPDLDPDRQTEPTN
jgi:formate-dependent nitrite reductase membrane component NrfD